MRTHKRLVGWIVSDGTGEGEPHSTECDCGLCGFLDEYYPGRIGGPATVSFGHATGPSSVRVQLPNPETRDFISRADGVSMDGALDREVTPEDRGWYRAYSALGWPEPSQTVRIEMQLDAQDAAQIALELARECPVTAQIVFCNVDGCVEARLVSYTAFA